jgi:hypothetical protein
VINLGPRVQMATPVAPAVPAIAMRPLESAASASFEGMPLAEAPKQPAGAGLYLTTEALQRAASEMAGEHPVLDMHAIAERAREGLATTSKEINEAEQIEISMQLVVLLPIGALADICGKTVAQVMATSPRDIVRHVARKARRKWVPSTMYGALRAWIRLLLWLQWRDVEMDEYGSFDGIAYGDYLEEVDRAARERCDQRQAEREKMQREGKPVPGAGKKPQDGSHAADGQEAHLAFLTRNWGVRLPIKAAAFTREPSRKPPQPARPPERSEIKRLEEYMLKSAHDPATNNVGAFLMCAWGSVRTEQAQSCYIEGRTEGLVHAVAELDKHPRPEKRQPRPFWVVIPGGERVIWYDCFERTLVGNEGARAMYLEDDSPDGDPWKAKRTFPAPKSKQRIAVALRAMARRVLGYTEERAQRFTLHMARHYMSHEALDQKLLPEDQVEVGRWSGSVAQMCDASPEGRLLTAHRLKVRTMPERYAGHAAVKRVWRIITALHDAARANMREL